MDLFGPVAEAYASFAVEVGDESPTFAEWARSVARDPELIAWISALPQLKRQPNLVFAAARWHGVAAPGPCSGLRTALLEDAGPIRETIMTRSTQTNEVGRLATLLPAFSKLGTSLCLIEVGASAGLCLYPDRYDYRWDHGSDERTLTGSGGPLLSATAEGRVPRVDRHPAVDWRAGIDLNPLDVTDADQMAWLTNLVWPEQDDRRARLLSAISLTRADPPRIVAGDLLAELPSLISEAPGVPVVFHSAVISYLPEPQRAEFAAMMTGLVSRGSCHWVSNEGPRVLPGVRVPEPRPAARFLLCVDGEPRAWTHGHGRSISWL